MLEITDITAFPVSFPIPQDKMVTLELDEDAREWIAEKGYDEKMGARPMARVIQEHIKRPLAEELLFGELVSGGHIQITLVEDGLDLTLTPEEESLPPVSAGDED